MQGKLIMPEGMDIDDCFLCVAGQSVCVTGTKTNSLRVFGKDQYLTGCSQNPSLLRQPGWGQILSDFVIMMVMTRGQPAWRNPGGTDRDAGVGSRFPTVAWAPR
jgi:hypothetical protein